VRRRFRGSNGGAGGGAGAQPGHMFAPSFARFTRRAANATWRDVDWARAQLQPHAGKILRVVAWPPGFADFTLQISAAGDWDDATADNGRQADAVLRLSPAMLPRLAMAPDKPGAAVDLDGETALVQALRDLFDVLPLAIEERLASLIGPIAAHGISSAMRALASWPGYAALRIGAGLAAYLTEESATLLKRNTFEAFGNEVAGLRERVDRLADGARTVP
jgi:ubiquinone biosynthesis accessory factor UbiJ